VPLAFLAALSVVPHTLTLVFGGDVMLNGIPPSPSTFAGIRQILQPADVAFANLEVPLTRSNTRTSRKSARELKKKDQWILRAWPEHAPFLRSAGIDAVSLGNNHAMDFGPDGLEEMRRLLLTNNIVAAGAGVNANDANRLAVYCHPDGTKIGMVSVLTFMSPGALRKTTPATLDSPGVAVLSFGGNIDVAAKTKLKRWILHARQECDKLVVAVHWGTERKTLPNPYQVALGRAIADAGADVVWGNHPHVLQGAEIYKGVPILYSLGNMISASPGDTGFVQVRFEGRRAHLDFFPARIRGNRVAATPAAEALGDRLKFTELCTQIQQKYPNPYTCAPALRLFTGNTKVVLPAEGPIVPPKRKAVRSRKSKRHKSKAAIIGHGRGRALHGRSRQIQPPHQPLSRPAHVVRRVRRRDARGRLLHLRPRRKSVSRLPRRVRHVQPRTSSPKGR
jgi:poly-gamma-glutamate synthesis protein (capsule biosynthesis protein)